MAPYERLDAWRMAHRLALSIYKVTDDWPSEERFGLIMQVRRAALSVAVNIAEGSAKRGHREFRRFLDISLGSLSELTYLLRFSRDRGLLTPETWIELESLRDLSGILCVGHTSTVKEIEDGLLERVARSVTGRV